MAQRITPIDVLNTRFTRRFAGYALTEVDEFVQKVASDLEAALTESATQKEKIAGLERELGQYRNLETAMRDALMLAQKAADETRAAAQFSSDGILQEAHRRAAEVEVAADRVKMEHRRTVHEVRAKLRAHLEWLEREAPEQNAIHSLPTGQSVSLSDSISDLSSESRPDLTTHSRSDAHSESVTLKAGQ
ncbi:MAG: DivIVA domain-containing protein [Chthonomonadaceae bacterium]|nr:DivIVA domain-containing protein [Chthonomonadaceae bacterium]